MTLSIAERFKNYFDKLWFQDGPIITVSRSDDWILCDSGETFKFYSLFVSSLDC